MLREMIKYRHVNCFKSPALLAVLVLLLSAQTSLANGEVDIQKPNRNQCEDIIIGEDFDARYKKIKMSLEEDFLNGKPKKLKQDLIGVREQIDKLSLEVYELESKDPQEFQHFALMTVQALDTLIDILPKASDLAPKMRNQYVVPLTNINSLKADYQDCLMREAIEQAQEEIKNDKNINDALADRANTYANLASELNELNNNLYNLETTNIQKLVDYRAQLMLEIENYNKLSEKSNFEFQASRQIPAFLHSVHTEIERVLPGLQLSKSYYSHHK